MAKNRVRTCSSKNCKGKYFAKGFCRRHYRQIPEVKVKEKEYSKKRNQMPEVRAKQKASKMTPEYKAKHSEYMQEYNRRPEVRKKKREFNQTPERKAQIKEYKQRPEVKAKNRAYSQRPENKAKQKARDSRPDAVARRKALYSTPEYKAKRKSNRNSERLEVLQYYSKLLSKSNIPCCRCCGENFHIDFLAVDHIAGIKKMDFEPELVKSGYSSSMGGTNLMHWIIANNFPTGFQILCHNCNVAKGYSKNKNKCPHEKIEKILEE